MSDIENGTTWVCLRCNQVNDLHQIRCKKCGSISPEARLEEALASPPPDFGSRLGQQGTDITAILGIAIISFFVLFIVLGALYLLNKKSLNAAQSAAVLYAADCRQVSTAQPSTDSAVCGIEQALITPHSVRGRRAWSPRTYYLILQTPSGGFQKTYLGYRPNLVEGTDYQGTFEEWGGAVTNVWIAGDRFPTLANPVAQVESGSTLTHDLGSLALLCGLGFAGALVWLFARASILGQSQSARRP